MSSPEIPLGARVAVSAGTGIVRWTGVNPKFSAGRWVGIELDSPTGKNNGTVQGEVYFECEPNHGVFVRPSQVRILDARAATPAAPGTATPARRQSLLPKSGSSASIARTPGSTPATTSRAPTPKLPSGTPRSVSRTGTRTGTPATPPRAPSTTSTTSTIKRPLPASARQRSGAPRGTGVTARRASTLPGAAHKTSSSIASTASAATTSTASTPIASPVTETRRLSTLSTSSSTSAVAALAEPSSAKGSSPASVSPSPSHGSASMPPPPPPGAMAPPPVPTGKGKTAMRPPPLMSAAEREKRLMGPPPLPSPMAGIPPPSPRGIPQPSPTRAIPSPRGIPPPSPTRSGIPVQPNFTSPSPTGRRPSSAARKSILPTPSPTRAAAALPDVRATTPSEASVRAPSPQSDAEQDGASVSGVSAARSAGTTIRAPPSPQTMRTNLSVRSVTPDRDAAAAVFAQKRELEELRIKVRLLETRRAEDHETIKSLEKKATDADQLQAIRARLQVKFQEQQSALVNAQRSARDLQSENTHLETRVAEAFDQLEMATLDREVAEEKAELAEAEVERLNEKIQELELEVAVLNEENAEYEKPISGLEGERSSLAFVQLEKHNERLKEALIRLRDVSTETEKEQKSKISDLERELNEHEDLKSRLELADAKLSSAEAQVEDLKQQLDDALGAEDLLEELTERNLQMSEKIEDMRATIDDLEALKELSDELEENHVATERQLEEEASVLTNKLRDEAQRAADLEAVVVDMETTIGQFRELVANLQSEIDTLRVVQATQEYESATASKESQALLNLNLKLQSSAAKTQSKTIDLELKKLEAAQLTEHLRIVQAYLPEAYQETEEDSTTALLFFHRVAAKVDMLTNVISNLHGLPAALHSAASEALVGVCELRGKLRHFATLNRRFAAVMCRAEPEDYGNLGKVVSELIGVEPKVDGWVALVKTDEFNEGDCARELDALIAQFNHLSEVMFDRPGLDAGEQQLALAYTFEDDLDNFAAAVGFVRQAVVSLVKDGDVDIDTSETTLEEGVYDPIQRILNQVRAVHAPASKLVAVVEETVASQRALLPEFTAALQTLVTSVSGAVDTAVQLAQRINAHISSIRSSKEPLRLTDIDKFLAEVVTVEDGMAPWDVIGGFMTRLGTDLGDILPKFRGAAKAGQTMSLDVPPPWLARVEAIKEAASHNAEAERQLSRLSQELKDMVREVKLRDQSLQESDVKVETLERRLEASRKQADLILELESDITKAKKQEKVYEDALEQLQAEQDALEAENQRLRKARPDAAGDMSPTAAVATSSVEASHLLEQIDALRSAVRFLRSENGLLKARDLYNDVAMLAPLRPLRPAPARLPALALVPPVPELVASRPGADSDVESEGPVTPPRGSRAATRITLDTESKRLFRDLAAFAAAPRIVDISGLGGSKWTSRKNAPDIQVWRWKEERRALETRVQDLKGRVAALGARR